LRIEPEKPRCRFPWSFRSFQCSVLVSGLLPDPPESARFAPTFFRHAAWYDGYEQRKPISPAVGGDSMTHPVANAPPGDRVRIARPARRDRTAVDQVTVPSTARPVAPNRPVSQRPQSDTSRTPLDPHQDAITGHRYAADTYPA